MTDPPIAVAPATRGRPPKVTAEQIAEVALRLWDDRGYDEVPMTEIAEAAGVTVRTVFRYFRAKSDIIWGEFEHDYGDLSGRLRGTSPDLSLLARVRTAVVQTVAGAQREQRYLVRLRVISRTPDLQHRMPEYFDEWRTILDTWIGEQLPGADTALESAALARAVQSTTLNALLWWSGSSRETLDAGADKIVDRALRALETAAEQPPRR